MKSMTETLMSLEITRDKLEPGQQLPAGRSLGAGFHDLNQQCLRILRCTAQALANSPGGLRFKANTQPWLEGLAAVQPMRGTRPVLAASGGRHFRLGLPAGGTGA